MELGIYIITASLCIFWSIKLYNDWFFTARYDEGDIRRVFLLIIPASFFIVFLLLTWSLGDTFRFDILVLIIYDSLILVSLVLYVISKRIINKRKAFVLGLAVYLLLSLILFLLSFFIRKYPLLLMKITFYLDQLGNFTLIRTALFSFEAESETEAMTMLLNKVIIAVISYLPVSIIRIIYFRRSQQRLLREIKDVRKRVMALESIVVHE